MYKILTTPKAKHFHDVLCWLEEEENETGGGFYCNKNVIATAFRDSRLHCVMLDEFPIAFAVFSVFSPMAQLSIMEVHPAHRRRGIGRLLATHMFEYLRRRGAKYVYGESVTHVSELFWRDLGCIDAPPQPETRFGRGHLLRWVS
jgi:GNAT superfamily N-acetyltransferase